MKKILLSILAVAGLVSTAFAASTTGNFGMSVTVPAATTVSFIVSRVHLATAGEAVGGIDVGDPIFEPNPDGNTLSFPVTFNSSLGIYLGDYFFAIDMAPNGAPNYTSISFSYDGNTIPGAQPVGEGLNKRGVMTAVKVVGSAETALNGDGTVLGGVLPSLTNAQVNGGFLRTYVGLATGELVGGPGSAQKVPGSVPFSNADAPGAYSGTFHITAVLP